MFESNILAIEDDKIEQVIANREAFMPNLANIDIQATIDNAVSRAPSRFRDVKGDVAVIPIQGFISHRATIWAAMGLESSSELTGMWIDSALANKSVGAIVLDVNSPGGTVHGLTSISDKIYNARGQKPIIAVSNSLMASAAYFIASAADEIIADPDSLTGSIGSVAVHVEQSKALEDAGIKATVIRSAEHKYEGNPIEPLSDETKAYMQEQVDSFAGSFVSAVSRNRDISEAKIKANFGKGRVMRAEEAKSVGMVDRIATFESLSNRLRSSDNRRTVNRAKLSNIKINAAAGS